MSGKTPFPIATDDPAYQIVVAAKEIQAEGLKQLGAIVQRCSDDVAATCAVAEKAARVRAETVITQAGEWAAQRIHSAGESAAMSVCNETDTLRNLADDLRYTLRWCVIFSAVTAAIAAGSLFTLIFRLL